MKKALFMAAAVSFSTAALTAGEVVLADNGKTDYAVNLKENPTRSEKIAAGELRSFLKMISGADFRKAAGKNKNIWVGKVAPSDKKPLAQDERRLKMDNGDLYIYGQGEHGNVNAVYDFLRDRLGCRWFTFYGVSRIPKQKRIVLPDDLCHSVIPSIPYMTVSNVAMSPAFTRFARRNFLRDRAADCIGSYDTHAGQLVIPSGLIPFGGKVGNIRGPLKYFKDKAYFKTNPDFFAMDKKGNRVTSLQLCYTNPKLQDEFEKNIKIMLKTEKYKGGMRIIGVGQDDNGGGFCYCPSCTEAVERHDHPAGPYYDFLYDLSKRFEKSHPELLFSFLAYRDYQTLRPSKLLKELPANLLPSYAPLGVDFSKPISHPTNGSAAKNFANWAKIAKKMHWWAYPTPYPRPIVCYPLIANINRIAENFRIAHRNKVWMAYCEFGSGAYSNLGFNDLRTYMLSNLCRNINSDVPTIIREFTDAVYGPAAEDMRNYLAELEALELTHPTALRWNPSILDVQYATAANLLRWSKLFDRMEAKAGKSAKRLLALRRARFSLDETILAKWSCMTPEEQAAFGDLEEIIARVSKTARDDMKNAYESLNRLDRERCSQMTVRRTAWLMSGLDQYIASARGGKALPDFFKGKKVYRIMPDRNKLGLDADKEAAFGLCNTGIVPKRGNWLMYRSYQRDRDPAWIVKRLPQPLTLKRIKQNPNHEKYSFYHLGAITLERDSQINFTTISRISSYAVGHLYDPAKPGRLFDLYVSMAVDLKKGTIRQDQLVLVERTDLDGKERRSGKDSGIRTDTQDMFQ